MVDRVWMFRWDLSLSACDIGACDIGAFVQWLLSHSHGVAIHSCLAIVACGYTSTQISRAWPTSIPPPPPPPYPHLPLTPWPTVTCSNTLMLSRLMASLANTKWCKKKQPRNGWKTWRVGTHLGSLSKRYRMNTIIAWLRWFSKYLRILVLWTKVALALEGLITQQYARLQIVKKRHKKAIPRLKPVWFIGNHRTIYGNV